MAIWGGKKPEPAPAPAQPGQLEARESRGPKTEQKAELKPDKLEQKVEQKAENRVEQKVEPKPVKPESKPVVDQPAPKREVPMAMLKREDETARGGEVNAILGRGTEFEGKLSFEGEVRIAGKFTGEIFSKDRLQIDESAKVNAEVTAGAVVVFGEVNGNIKASQLIELKASARVKGNIESPSLVIEKGVLFEGSCKMENLGKGATVTPLKQAEEKK